ncbi:PAS domain S-box protein [Balneolaceae bacterium YR4-1]|uniref:histidine kinase n=1 Tax=Halalkalibaculum roseum TaxID=2709311 RepID=A0A6M1SQL7_9BACT|nr:PAS domain S-box protein [Halalkalibaculum roseum]NGP75100.1 PAS domain S-box protein [Halalkalibaculum roseum]
MSSIERIAKSIHGILWEADAETFRFLYVSPQSKEILGYEPSQWYASETFWADHIHPEDRKKAVFYCHQQTKLGQSHEFEYRMVDSKGGIIWLKDVVSVIFEDGKPSKLRGLMVDITKQKSTEFEKRRLLDEAYTLAKIGHWEYDISAQSLYWSREVKSLHEVPKYYVPDVASAIEFYKEGESRQQITEAVTEAIKEGTPYDLELQIITAKGNTRWIRTLGKAEIVNGEVVRIYGSTQDVSQLKKEKEYLEMLSMVASETQNIVIITDPDQGIKWVNNAFEKKTGYLLKDIVGKNPGTLLQGPKTDDETVKRISRRIKFRIPFTEEILNYTADGQPYWIKLNVTPIYDKQGKLKQFFSIQEDITEQKKSEIVLKEQITFSNSIINSLPGLFYMMDEDLKLLKVNNNARTFFNIQKSNLARIDPFSVVAPKDRKILKSKVEEAFQNGYMELETTVILDDKKYIFYVNGKLIELDENKYLIGNGLNITDRKNMQKNNEILLKEVHHRVKNNLAIVSGLLSLEMEELPDVNAKLPMQRCINRISSMAKVHELLYVNQNFTTVNIGDYIRELTKVVENTFSNERRVHVSLDIEQMDMNVNEAIPLGMLINELLTNSYKYAFEDNDGQIKITIQKISSRYHVVYQDNGKGVKGDISLGEVETLGMLIIKTLLDQLEADYKFNTEEKFELKMEFDPRLRGSHSNLSEGPQEDMARSRLN